MAEFDVRSDVWAVAQTLQLGEYMSEAMRPYVEASQIYKPIELVSGVFATRQHLIVALTSSLF